MNLDNFINFLFRIFFLHPDGSLLSDVINKDGNSKFKYYYFSTDSILTPWMRCWSYLKAGGNPPKMSCDLM